MSDEKNQLKISNDLGSLSIVQAKKLLGISIDTAITRCKDIKKIHTNQFRHQSLLTGICSVVIIGSSMFLNSIRPENPELRLDFYLSSATPIMGGLLLLSKELHDNLDFSYKNLIHLAHNELLKDLEHIALCAQLDGATLDAFITFLNQIASPAQNIDLLKPPFKELMTALLDNPVVLSDIKPKAQQLIATCKQRQLELLHPGKPPKKQRNNHFNLESKSRDPKSKDHSSKKDSKTKDTTKPDEHKEEQKNSVPLTTNNSSLRKAAGKTTAHSSPQKFNGNIFRDALAKQNESILTEQLSFITERSQLTLAKNLTDNYARTQKNQPEKRIVKFVRASLDIQFKQQKKSTYNLLNPSPEPVYSDTTNKSFPDTTATSSHTVSDAKHTPVFLPIQRRPAEATQALVMYVTKLRTQKLKKQSLLREEKITEAGKLKLAPPMITMLEVMFEIMQQLEQASSTSCCVLAVGGLPRDILLNKKAKDIDLATNISLTELKLALKKLHTAEKNIEFWIIDKIPGKVILGVRYKDHSIQIQCEAFCLHEDGRINRDSLIKNSHRNFTVNGLFVDSNGDFQLTSDDIDASIMESLKKQGDLNQPAGTTQKPVFTASPGYLAEISIETLVPEWKGPNWQRLLDTSGINKTAVVEIAKNYIADPKRIFHILKYLLHKDRHKETVGKLERIICSTPTLLTTIFSSSLKLNEKNTMQIVLGFEDILRELLNQPVTRPTVTTTTLSPTLPEKKKLSAPLGEEAISTTTLLQTLKQRFKHYATTRPQRDILLFALQVGANPKLAADVTAAYNALFTQIDSNPGLTQKSSFTLFDNAAIQNWLIERLIKTHIIDKMPAFAEKASLGLTFIKPKLEDKMLPFAIAIWWQQRKSSTFPTKNIFCKQIAALIWELPFLRHALPNQSSLDTIIGDSHDNLVDYLLKTDTPTQTTHSSSMPPTKITSTPKASVNSTSYWKHKPPDSKTPRPQNPMTPSVTDGITPTQTTSGALDLSNL